MYVTSEKYKERKKHPLSLIKKHMLLFVIAKTGFTWTTDLLFLLITIYVALHAINYISYIYLWVV